MEVSLFRFLVLRITSAFIQVMLVTAIVFGLIHMIPGDPVMVILGSESTPDPAVVEAVRAQLGLDKPILAQYVDWMKDLAKLDLGISFANGKPVWDEISKRFPRSIELIAISMFFSIFIGIFLGIVSALNRGKVGDWATTVFAIFGISIPVYVIGTLLVLFLGVQLKLLPIAGYIDPAEDLIEHIRRLILPVIALSLGPTAIFARMTRSAMLDVLNQNYILTARSKGLAEKVIIAIHALRPALVPIVTVIGLQLGGLLGGSVLVEYIFNWPGLATLLVTAIGRRDYPTVQAVILVIAMFYIVVNTVVDLSYGAIDPRIRKS